MSTNKTHYYTLHAWEPGDNFLRSEFNENFEVIDAKLKLLADRINAEKNAREAALAAEQTARETALAAEQTAREQAVSDEAAQRSAAVSALTTGKAEVATGFYTGNGEASQAIYLGFQPQAVLVVSDGGAMRSNDYTYGGLAILGRPVFGSLNKMAIEITATGFTVYKYTYCEVNNAGSHFRYVALK